MDNRQKSYYITSENKKYLKIKPDRNPNFYWTSLIYATNFEQDKMVAGVWLQIVQKQDQNAKIVEM